VTMKIERHVLMLTLGYLGTAAAAGGGGYYCYEEYKIARDEEATLRKQIEMSDVKIARIGDLEVDVICLRENLSHSVRILPNSKEVNAFVKKLNDFADEAGVQINTLENPIDRSKNKEGFDKVIYKAESVANMHQFLKFLALAEGWERFVRVTKIEAKAGDWKADMAREDVRHDISVDLETYSYTGADDAAKAVAIPNYDRRVEQLQDEILLRRSENQVETYTLVENPLRRDYMVDPRHRVTDEVEGGWPYADQKALVDSLVTLAADLASLTQSLAAPDVSFIRRLEIETDIDRKMTKIQEDLAVAMTPEAVTDLSLKRRLERDVRPIVQTLLARDPDVTTRATVADLKRFRDEMRRLVGEGKFDQVLKKHQTIKGRVDGKTLTSESAQLLQEIDRAALEAEVAIDFSTKKLDIRGAIVADSGSVVVVNSKVLHEGDAIGDDLFIHRIAPDRIEFRYRGVVLSRVR
jgi:Tfp pilus assembly protein PilO